MAIIWDLMIEDGGWNLVSLGHSMIGRCILRSGSFKKFKRRGYLETWKIGCFEQSQREQKVTATKP